tara:strand:+ start:244 stop:531 length:288 start_codon:yes stop_codon:yes gene_type:complete
MFCAALAFSVLLSAQPASADEDTDIWTVRMRRIEGAAVDARRAAEGLQGAAIKINSSKDLGNIPALKTQLEALNRWVISARMAVDLAEQEAVAGN